MTAVLINIARSYFTSLTRLCFSFYVTISDLSKMDSKDTSTKQYEDLAAPRIEVPRQREQVAYIKDIKELIISKSLK